MSGERPHCVGGDSSERPHCAGGGGSEVPHCRQPSSVEPHCGELDGSVEAHCLHESGLPGPPSPSRGSPAGDPVAILQTITRLGKAADRFVEFWSSNSDMRHQTDVGAAGRANRRARPTRLVAGAHRADPQLPGVRPAVIPFCYRASRARKLTVIGGARYSLGALWACAASDGAGSRS